MALDAITLSLVAQELKKNLIDAKIDKIYEPTRDEVVLQLRTRTGGYRLFCSARSGSARIGLTTEKFENPATPPSFCMLLRKHLTGGRLLDVRFADGERILFLDFQCTNEMADTVVITFSVELMGRYSNLVIFHKDGKIIDALKRVDFEASEIRQLLPGLDYTMPPLQARPYFMTVSSEGVIAALADHELPVQDALMRTCGGIGPVVSREIAFRAFKGEEVYANKLSLEQKKSLIQVLNTIKELYQDGGKPCMVKNQHGKPIEFSFMELTQYLPTFTLETFDSYSEMFDAYYSTKDKQERLRQKSKELTRAVKNMYERAVRKQSTRREELQQSQKSDDLRVYGELIQANLYQMEKGQKSVTLDNYYTGEKVIVPLDLRLTPSANAQKYFKNYKKKQTAIKMLDKLLLDGEYEITYFETVLDAIDRAEGEQSLNDIRMELKGQGYLKYFKLKDKKQKPSDFIRYQSTDGFLILVGRNNTQNDKLTIKTARGKDLWFHTKNAPGSHVVIMSEGDDIPNLSKNEAAQLAVLHSSQSGGNKVAVDYTEVRNIKKTADLKIGMVIYDNYETAYISQDNDVIEKIKKLN